MFQTQGSPHGISDDKSGIATGFSPLNSRLPCSLLFHQCFMGTSSHLPPMLCIC